MASRPKYRPIFSESAVTFFVGQPKRRQRKLLDRAHELAADPFLVPDFSGPDETGRIVSHLLVDGFIFDYWVDDAMQAVLIVEIGDAE